MQVLPKAVIGAEAGAEVEEEEEAEEPQVLPYCSALSCSAAACL